MNKILLTIKKIIPKKILVKIRPIYHLFLNWIATIWHGFPSEKLIVIGVTGTTGKTTVVFMIKKILQEANFKVGYTSTAMFSDGDKEWLNDKKMTMLGRFFTQKMLNAMVKNNCEVAIVETTSEGIVQNRHRFINYDICLFTGLYPEHIESHGSFEKYKQAKLKLFKHLEKSKRKKNNLKKKLIKQIPKTIIVNLNDKHAKEFLNYKVEEKIGFFEEKNRETINRKFNKKKFKRFGYSISNINQDGLSFIFNNQKMKLPLLGEFNVSNAVAAICTAQVLGLDNQELSRGVESIKNLPGRIERIEEGQNFKIIVDYAFEPIALQKLYKTISVFKSKKIIHVLGSAGGGRDISRREKLGKIAGEKADFVIVTNEDPYDDDPLEIIKMVAKGSLKSGKIKNKDLFLIEDRQKAIEKAISLAQKNDLILVTGKGSEQAIAGPKGKLIPWDDRKVIRKILKQKYQNK